MKRRNASIGTKHPGGRPELQRVEEPVPTTQ